MKCVHQHKHRIKVIQVQGKPEQNQPETGKALTQIASWTIIWPELGFQCQNLTTVNSVQSQICFQYMPELAQEAPAISRPQ